MAATLEEFGKKIKEKYPQYGNIDDKELALKMLEKYPEYKDRVFDTDPQAQAQISGAETSGVLGTIKKGFTGLKDTLSGRVDKVAQIAGSDQNIGSKVLQTAGQGFATIGDTIGAGIGTAASIATPDEMEEKIKQKFAQGVSAVSGTDTAQKVVDFYRDMKVKHPEIVGDAEAVGNILDAFANAIGVGAGAKGAEVAVKVGMKEAGNLATDVTKIATDTIESAADMTKRGIKFSEPLAKKVSEKASDIITPIEPGVQTFLEKGGEVAKSSKLKKLNDYVKQAEEAVMDFSKPTPLEIAGGEAEKSVKKIGEKLSKVGEYKSKVVESLSEINVGQIASDARKELRVSLSERLGSTLTKSGIKSAPGRVSSVSDKADTNVIKLVDKKLAELGNNPTFRKVDDTVDYIQDILYKRSSNLAVPVNTKVEGVVKSVIGTLNNRLKTLKTGDAVTDRLISEYKKANEAYGKIKGTRDELNKMLGEKGKRAGALMKRVFSPSDAGTKKLFAEVKKLTGIDLVDEATLAKFVMENAGDARQASLLEEAIKGNVTSARSFIAAAADKVIGKLQNPIGKARRIIEKSGKVEKTLLQKAGEVKDKADEAVNEAAKKAGSRLKEQTR